MKYYRYKVVKEDYTTGVRSKRTRIIEKKNQLTVGGLYIHLGDGFRGTYRVLEGEEIHEDEDD